MGSGTPTRCVRAVAAAGVLIALITTSCGDDVAGSTTTTARSTTSTPSATTAPSTTVTLSTTSSSTSTSTTVPVGLPIATDDAPSMDVLFSLRVGEEVTYQGDFTLTDFPLTGPQALTVDHEGTIWLADTEALRIVRFGADGEVLLDIDTDADGVGPIIDIAPYRDGLLALEVVAALNRHRLVQYSNQGELLAAVEIPPGYHLGDGLTGIATGPSGEIWIELGGEATVHEVTSLESPVVPRPVRGYRIGSTDLVPMAVGDGLARFGIGDVVVEVPFREFGSLLYEGALPGAISLLHSNVWYDDVIVVDDTVVYFDLEGAVLAEADYPLDDVVYVPQERIAVAPDGRLIALVPRLDRLDVVSLTLYPPGHFGLDA